MEKNKISIPLLFMVVILTLSSCGMRGEDCKTYEIEKIFSEVHAGETHYYVYVRKNQYCKENYNFPRLRIEISQELYDNLETKKYYPYFYFEELQEMGIRLPAEKKEAAEIK